MLVRFLQSIHNYCTCSAYYIVVMFCSCFLDIDECAMNTSSCDQICVNTFGSYMCTCRSGFMLNNMTNQCEGNSILSKICTVMSFHNARCMSTRSSDDVALHYLSCPSTIILQKCSI